MRNFARVLLVIAVIILAASAVTACRSGIGNPQNESQETGTDNQETLLADSSAALTTKTAQTTQVTNLADQTDYTAPTTSLSGALLGSIGDESYVWFSGGPLFTYKQADDVLLAYCYAEGSSHLPYDLTYGATDDGSVNQFVIPEFDLIVYYYFDADFGIWRLFDYNPEIPPAEGGNSEIQDWSKNEFRVYLDTDDILTYADHLYRFNYSFCTPRYVEHDEMLYYIPVLVDSSNFEDGYEKNISVDMDGDKIQEQIHVAPVGLTSSGGCMNNYSISINGLDKIDVQMCISFIGISVVDISKEDSYKEVICEFVYEDCYTQNYIIRYDGDKVNCEEFSCIYDIPGNGSVLVGDGQFLQTVTAKKEYSVDSSFTFTQKEHLFDTDINVTSRAPVQVKYDVDGEYVDGILETGTKIKIYMVDYVSKAFFVTDAGRKGLLTLEGLTVLPDGIATNECFDGLLWGG